jgi:DNA-binding beta-propeller fold protein YncE
MLPIVHSIAIDRHDNVYVADRGNHRVQVFDTDGKFLRMCSIDVPPVSGTKAVNGNTPAGDRLTTMITVEGKVIGVIGRSGRQLKQFSGAHALACPSETELYVAESSNWRVQKLILHPKTQATTASR